MNDKIEDQNDMIKKLEAKIEELTQYGDVEEIFTQLQARNKDFRHLEQSMLDMRNALTAEVAEKHDVIVMLRRNTQQLEEQCKQANKQTHFKDDIIKELRKELKQMKQEEFQETILNLQDENKNLQGKIVILEKQLNELKQDIKTTNTKSHNIIIENLNELERMISSNTMLNAISNIREYTKMQKLQFLLLEREMISILQEVHEKDKQLMNQFDIIKALVIKLNTINEALKLIDEKSKKYKTKCSNEQCGEYEGRIEELEDENATLKHAIRQAKDELNELENQAENYLQEKEEYKRSLRNSLGQIDDLTNALEKTKTDLGSIHEEDASLIDGLKEENEKQKNELENVRRNSKVAIEELEKAMMLDLEGFEKKYHENQETINDLRSELESEKHEHRKSIDRVLSLNEENREQYEMIENLQAAMKKKSSNNSIESEGIINSLKSELENEKQEHRKSIDRIICLSEENREIKEKLHVSKDPQRNITQLEKSESVTCFSIPNDIEEQIIPSTNKGLLYNEPSKKDVKCTQSHHNTTTDEEDLETVIGQLSSSIAKMTKREKNAGTQSKTSKIDDQLSVIRNKDEIIKIQNETLNIIQIELQALKEKEADYEAERCKRNQEVTNLKLTINELENALKNTQGRADNLQKAVDLYLNSVNVLEASEERSKIEIEQQRLTINNLQEALITNKQEFEKLKQKTTQELQQQWQIIYNVNTYLIDTENHCKNYYNQIDVLLQINNYLQDINLDMEVEKVNFLSELVILESRLLKYQNQRKVDEQCICALKTEVKKLRGEKARYENIIKYLKGEMRVLADQLSGLQNLLGSSNAIVLNENAELLQNVQDLQSINKALQNQLSLMQQELLCEHKKNEGCGCQIKEMQQTIAQKTNDITRWDAAYRDIKQTLDTVLVQNKELQTTIVQMQNELQQYEQEQVFNEERSSCCRKEINVCKENLCGLKEKMNIMKQLLNKKTEECNQLKMSLEDQTKIMACFKKECESNKVHFSENVADLKHIIKELNEKLKKTEYNNHTLNEELKFNQVKLIETTERETEQQKEYAERERELTEKLHHTQTEEVRLIDLVTQLEHKLTNLNEQVHIKDEQLKAIRLNIQKLKGNKSPQLNLAQEEIITLKDELNKTMQLQHKLKAENEKLRGQVTHLQSTITSYEERNQIISEQLEQCLIEIQTIQTDKEFLEQSNEELKQELNALQNAFSNLSREYRQKTESVMNLEMKLVDTKSTRNELCDESRKVVNNVRAWLYEQKKINNKLLGKVKAKNNTIKKLKNERDSLLAKAVNTNKTWSLGSQGSRSASPATSITSSIHEEWCTYTEPTENDEDMAVEPEVWIHRVESMTEQLHQSNQYWQSKMNENDYMVSRDQ